MGLISIAAPTDVLSGSWCWTAITEARHRLIRLFFVSGGSADAVSALARKVEARQHSENNEARQFLVNARDKAAEHRLEDFKRLIVPQMDAAYNFARFLCRDADAADDIVQNAFLRAFRAFDRYRGGDLRSWIMTIVRNCHYDWLSERRRKEGLEAPAISGSDDDDDTQGIEAVPSSGDTPEAALLRKREAEDVRLVLTTLPSSLREVLVLREIEGFSYREIADITAVPIGTVMSRLARARKEFGEAWQKHNQEGRP